MPRRTEPAPYSVACRKCGRQLPYEDRNAVIECGCGALNLPPEEVVPDAAD